MLETQRSATIQRVLEYLHYNAGTTFRPEDLCAMLDCDPVEARTALEALVAASQIERRQAENGAVSYIAPRSL
jgi:DNA-binding MarR family transcriptional regulator